MKITLTGEESLRVEPEGDQLTIESPSPDLQYSPFHMLGSALGGCTLFVLQSWASHKSISVDDLKVDVSWSFVAGEHRVGSMKVGLAWPSLSAELWPRAIRAASLCGVHNTLTHPPEITVVAPGAETAPSEGATVTTSAAQFTQAGRDITATSPAMRRGEEGRSYTVIYDGNCKVCGKLVRMLRKWDREGQLEIVPSQASGVRARFPWIPQRAYMDSVQVVRNRDGKTWQAAAALEELLNILPKGRLISWLFKIPFARPLANRFYRWFARNRTHFGCGDHCQVRPPDLDYGDA